MKKSDLRELFIEERVENLEKEIKEEVYIDGKKYYRYTSKTEYDAGKRAEIDTEEEGGSILPRVNRTRRTVIKL